MRNRFEVNGDSAALFLRRKDGTLLKTLIDPTDLARAQEFPNSWYASWNPATQSFYVYGKLLIGGKRKTVQLHRWIVDPLINFQVDHCNHDTLDNRRSNLRIATHAENAQNKNGIPRHNKSGFRGVSWCTRSRKWLAQVMVNGHTRHVGYFSDKEDAATAVQKARSELMPFAVEAV